MGKIILEFDRVEDASEAMDALNGTKWKIAMWNLDQKLRETTKYGLGIIDSTKDASEIEVDVADKIRGFIREILSENGLSLEE